MDTWLMSVSSQRNSERKEESLPIRELALAALLSYTNSAHRGGLRTHPDTWCNIWHCCLFMQVKQSALCARIWQTYRQEAGGTPELIGSRELGSSRALVLMCGPYILHAKSLCYKIRQQHKSEISQSIEIKCGGHKARLISICRPRSTMTVQDQDTLFSESTFAFAESIEKSCLIITRWISLAPLILPHTSDKESLGGWNSLHIQVKSNLSLPHAVKAWYWQMSPAELCPFFCLWELLTRAAWRLFWWMMGPYCVLTSSQLAPQ